MSASRQRAAQQKWCPDYERIMDGLEERLKEWVMEETEIRLKTLVLVVSDCARQWIKVQGHKALNESFIEYKIPRSVYEDFKQRASSSLHQKCEKGINFGRVTREMEEKEVWDSHKMWWFHRAPKEMSQSLWKPLLEDIADHFAQIARRCADDDNWTWNEHQITKFLALKFLKSALEVKCQVDPSSDPGGPLIQWAAWKIESMQQLIHRRFDDSYSDQWDSWLRQTGSSGKKLRINDIIQRFVRRHAQDRFAEFCEEQHIQCDQTQFRVESIKEMTLSQIFRGQQGDDTANPVSSLMMQPPPDTDSMAMTVSSGIESVGYPISAPLLSSPFPAPLSITAPSPMVHHPYDRCRGSGHSVSLYRSAPFPQNGSFGPPPPIPYGHGIQSHFRRNGEYQEYQPQFVDDLRPWTIGTIQPRCTCTHSIHCGYSEYRPYPELSVVRRPSPNVYPMNTRALPPDHLSVQSVVPYRGDEQFGASLPSIPPPVVDSLGFNGNVNAARSEIESIGNFGMNHVDDLSSVFPIGPFGDTQMTQSVDIFGDSGGNWGSSMFDVPDALQIQPECTSRSTNPLL